MENDNDARKTIQRNNPTWRLSTPSDIDSITPRTVLEQANLIPREVDIIAGGPPCQPFSKSAYWTNGGIRGVQDPRSNALKTYLEIVRVALPKMVLLENVRDLAVRDGSVGAFGLLQAGFAEINRTRKTNYDLQVIHVNAAEYGVPQARHRVFLIASIDGRRIALPPAITRARRG